MSNKLCSDCGGPGVTWEDGFVCCDSCARKRAEVGRDNRMWGFIQTRLTGMCQCVDCKMIRFLVAELTKAQVVAEELTSGSGSTRR